MAKYYTRHQSLKHLWYMRYNSRTTSIWDGTVPKCAFKSDAWRLGIQAAWRQLMEERKQLYYNENIAAAEIVDMETTKSGSTKLWVNVDNPYAEKWDFGDINGVTISKSKENLFQILYGTPQIGKIIFVTLVIYNRQGNTGFSYRIKYDIPESSVVNKIKEEHRKNVATGAIITTSQLHKKEPVQNQGCFIATAAYGTPMATEMNILRKWRDTFLLQDKIGRVFVKTYYRVSPPIAVFISKSDQRRAIVRKILKPLISVLKGRYPK